MKIFSIFHSIDGECNLWGQGTFRTFIRFSNCNLRCWYCDTKYAQEESSGKDMSVEEIFRQVEFYGCKKITITGGEPLLQERAVYTLIDRFSAAKYKISVETNGTQPIPTIFRWFKDLCWVVDYKLDYQNKMNYWSFANLTKDDFVKIPVEDFKQLAEAVLVRKSLIDYGCRARFFLSAVKPKYSDQALVEDAIKIKMFDFGINVPLHKYLWSGSKHER